MHKIKITPQPFICDVYCIYYRQNVQDSPELVPTWRMTEWMVSVGVVGDGGGVFIYLLMVFIYRPHVLTPRSGRHVRESGTWIFLGFLATPEIVSLLSNAKSAAQVPNHRCRLRCIIRSQFVATVQPTANTASLRMSRPEN